MNKAPKVACSIGLIGVAALVAAWWLTTPPPDTDEQEPAEAAAVALKATAVAVAQIAAESTGGAVNRDAIEPVEAPPGFVPGAELGDIESASNPPDGFEFTAFHGEMSTARMTPLDVAPPPDPIADQPWLATGTGARGLAGQAMAAGRDWTFGWVAINADADRAALMGRLSAAGAEVLGASGALLRTRLPGDVARLEEIAAIPGVAGIGPTPLAVKLPAPRDPSTGFRAVDGLVPTFVTLMADDPDGRFRRALTDLGGVVGRFDPSIRVYPANFPVAGLDTVAAVDFVLSVEPVGVVSAAHRSAVPVMGADAIRTYSANTGMFSGIGGGSVPVGVMDSGLNIRHEDIGTGRRSICGANFATFSPLMDRVEDQDLWVDDGLHGTHVTGTILGNGTGGAEHAGMAPLVQDIRFAKVLTSFGAGSLIGALRGMDFLGRPSACGPVGTPAQKPLIVNVSLGQDFPEWDGRSASERKLDAMVWNNRQLYVVAMSNSGFIAYGDLASTKNSLAVGAVEDGGDLASFSSHGPTADGRLKPQVVGAGVRVDSPRGEGRRSGYVRFSGTSMASPAVAGVAALLMDAAPDYQEQPAAVRARLMASAIRPDAFLDDAIRFPAHNSDGPGALQHRYGLGKVSARTSVLNRDEADGWVGGSAVVDLGDGEYGYRDIEVPEGASRLDVVMTWDERPADTFASTVQNDLDLWVDRDADCPPSQPAACGNAASRSTKDNVEWLILRNPPAGTYRLKVVPKHVRVETPRAALAWTVIRGPSTPQLSISPTASAVVGEPGRLFEVEATLTTSGYVAAGTVLRVDCRDEADDGVCAQVEPVAVKASRASREDGVARTLDGESSDAIALGEIGAGERQTVSLVFKQLPGAARFRLYLTAAAWNATSASTSVDVTIGDPEAAAPAVAPVPANDDFGAAAELAGDSGSRDFDLLLATPEPGEPAFAQSMLDEVGRFQSQRRPRSLWYLWTAPETVDVRLAIASAEDGIGDDVQIDVFEAQGPDMHDLEHLAAKFGGGATFAASRGQVYAIRLGITRARLFEYDDGQPVRRRSIAPMSLHWQRASVPENDDFELATEIGGESGAMGGSNLSATEQPGERLHPLAASTWYRWTAPADGDFRFGVDRRYLNVAAFTGHAVDDLRMVSGLPGQEAVFPARAGDSYAVAVAAGSAYSSGSDYNLTWAAAERATGNDDMADAQPIIGAPAFFHFAWADLETATVEPGEPVESGVRTAWWTWRAPSSSRYTWRATALFNETLAFSVVEVGDGLVPLGESSGHRLTEQQLTFDAVGGRQYLVSAGVPADQPFVPTRAGPISFEWGPTPANDDLANAATLAGVTGTALGSTAFATVAPNEPVALLGDSSVWWTWEVPESRWYRVSLTDPTDAGVVSVFELLADGALAHEPVAVSRRLPDPILVFRAEAGERYALRVGSDASHPGGEFALTWAPNGSPTWLRYAGAAVDGDIDPAGNVLDLPSPDSAAFNDDGSRMYVATESGLQVYARTAKSGALTHLQTLDGVDEDARLFWDSQTSSVIAVACAGVDRFAATESGVAHAGSIAGTVPCLADGLPQGTVLRDSGGTFVHLVSALGIVTLRFNEDRTEIAFVSGIPVMGILSAAMASDDQHVYAATVGGLTVYARDRTTGALAPVGVPGAPAVAFEGLGLLMAEPSGRYLFGVTADRAVAAFDLADPAEPVLVAQSEAVDRAADPFFDFVDFSPPASVGQIGFGPTCSLAVARQRTMTVDVMCHDLALSRRLLPGIPAVRQEDLLTAGGVDAFDNNLPYFRMDRAVVASPDGRHIYASAPRGILIFERAGSR